jgi:hypothetical protein
MSCGAWRDPLGAVLAPVSGGFDMSDENAAGFASGNGQRFAIGNGARPWVLARSDSIGKEKQFTGKSARLGGVEVLRTVSVDEDNAAEMRINLVFVVCFG